MNKKPDNQPSQAASRVYQRQRIPAPTPPGYTPAPTPQVYQRQRMPTNPSPPGYPPAGYPPPEVYRIPGQRRPARRRRSSCLLPGCLALILVMVCLGITAAGYLLFPGRTNLLVFGVDYVDPAIVGTQARSDTIILATVDPVNSYIGLLSVPRDLWVPIPGFGENRINTAHFFAETQAAGQRAGRPARNRAAELRHSGGIFPAPALRGLSRSGGSHGWCRPGAGEAHGGISSRRAPPESAQSAVFRAGSFRFGRLLPHGAGPGDVEIDHQDHVQT